ncbi:MAG: hypothetical protein AB1595_02490 [bacterium]
MQKTFQVELCVSSKLHDLTAKSAKTTLWEMGYKGLSDVSREIYFSFDVLAGNNNEAELIVENIVKKTSLFVNPNKDSYKIGFRRSGSDVREVNVLIWYIDDRRGEIIKHQLKNQGFDRILDVFQGELWHLFLSSKEELVYEIIEAFLVNPHSQKYCILKEKNGTVLFYYFVDKKAGK